MEASNAIFNKFGFAPSLSVCMPFAQQVLAEAANVMNFLQKQWPASDE